jgi:hypothetical protein
VEAAAVIDRALALWHQRPRDLPTFLYVHLMDLHMPRWLPEGELRFVDPALAWEARFSEGSQPQFDGGLRRWALEDARDFTSGDREIFTAFYDTVLAYTDAEVGRLIAAVRAGDPELRSVLVAVAADHGEQLGEEGWTGHTATLADGIHHIPFILAGQGVRPGQRFASFSENVDVAPTIVRLLGLDLAAETYDGRALIERDGRACESCGRSAVHYTWVSYQGMRKRGYLLHLLPPGSPEARCRGSREVLWRVHGASRERVAIRGQEELRAERLRYRLTRRLGRKEARFRSTLKRAPDRSFLVPARFWQVGNDVALTCTEVDAMTDRGHLEVPGWHYAGQSFVVMRGRAGSMLPVIVTAPNGAYQVDAGVVPVPRPPWLFGYDRWLRKHFRGTEPSEFVPVGAAEAVGGQLAIGIPNSIGLRQRVVSLRLTPQGAVPGSAHGEEAVQEPDYRERLRALGYIQDEPGQ